jgi:hypothetical protein
LFNILLKYKAKLNQKCLERICFGISILMTMGICSFWENCVEEIFNNFVYSVGELNYENCLITLIILENISKELNEIQINHRVSLRVNKYNLKKFLD